MKRMGLVVYLHPFLTLTLDEVRWSASRSALFTLREGTPRTLCVGRWESFMAGMDVAVRRKIPEDAMTFALSFS